MRLSHASESEKSRKIIKGIEVAPTRLMHISLLFFSLAKEGSFFISLSGKKSMLLSTFASIPPWSMSIPKDFNTGFNGIFFEKTKLAETKFQEIDIEIFPRRIQIHKQKYLFLCKGRGL